MNIRFNRGVKIKAIKSVIQVPTKTPTKPSDFTGQRLKFY